MQPVTGRQDAPPPAPPRELSQPEADRSFEVGEKRWIARLQGKGACGTGAYGLGLVEAIHFFAAEAPEKPLYEALLPRGRFGGLFPAELAELLAHATPIVLPEER